MNQGNTLQELINSAKEVVSCWESGDLAGAVRNLSNAVDACSDGIARVKVTVKGGFADDIEAPEGVVVEVHDYDCKYCEYMDDPEYTDSEGRHVHFACYNGDGNSPIKFWLILVDHEDGTSYNVARDHVTAIRKAAELVYDEVPGELGDSLKLLFNRGQYREVVNLYNINTIEMGLDLLSIEEMEL